MTAPPRPEWLFIDLDKEGPACKEVRLWIEHLERELESAEAALDRMRERPDPDSWRGP